MFCHKHIMCHIRHFVLLPFPAGHDPNDYEIGKRVGLETINIMNKDGSLNAAAGAAAWRQCLRGWSLPAACLRACLHLVLCCVPDCLSCTSSFAHSDA